MMTTFPWAKTGVLLSHDGTNLRCDYYPRHLCRNGEEPEFLYYLCRRREGDVPDLTPLAIDEALAWFNAHNSPAATVEPMVPIPKKDHRRLL